MWKRLRVSDWSEGQVLARRGGPCEQDEALVPVHHRTGEG